MYLKAKMFKTILARWLPGGIRAALGVPCAGQENSGHASNHPT